MTTIIEKSKVLRVPESAHKIAKSRAAIFGLDLTDYIKKLILEDNKAAAQKQTRGAKGKPKE